MRLYGKCFNSVDKGKNLGFFPNSTGLHYVHDSKFPDETYLVQVPNSLVYFNKKNQLYSKQFCYEKAIYFSLLPSSDFGNDNQIKFFPGFKSSQILVRISSP